MNKIKLTRFQLNELLVKVSVYFKDVTIKSDGTVKVKVKYDLGTQDKAIEESEASLVELGFKDIKYVSLNKYCLEIKATYTK